MIEINIGATVESNGQDIGRVESVVLDQESFDATHLVIKQGRVLKSGHLIMPIEWVITSDSNRVRIARRDDEMSALPSFEVQHYVRLDQMEQEHAEHPRSKVKPSDWVNYFIPLVTHSLGEPYSPPGVVMTDEMLSPSESAIKRGLPIESSDGHKIGEVQEIILDKPDWRLSGVIISRGMFLKQSMRVPADWVARIERERIVLNRSKQQIDDWKQE